MEMHDGNFLIKNVLDYKEVRTRNHNFKKIINEVKKRISTSPVSGNFVACFSKARDSLEQWRAYGLSGGVCLRLGAPKDGEENLVCGPDLTRFRVVYNNREKIRIIMSIINRFEKCYTINELLDVNDRDEDDDFIVGINHKLSYINISFKNDSFVHESEIRIVAESFYWKNTKFRCSNFGIIPYVCTVDRRGRDFKKYLPIREVIIGPNARQSLMAESVGTFLNARGYKDVEVTLSKVPFRG